MKKPRKPRKPKLTVKMIDDLLKASIPAAQELDDQLKRVFTMPLTLIRLN